MPNAAHAARRGDLRRAAEILNAGKKIAILAGQGALHATDELEQVAEKLGAPIVKALLGKAAVPDDSPYTTGGIGLLGTKPSQDAMEDCDTLLMVGTSFPYIEFLPKPGQGARRADRSRSHAHRPALSGGSGTGRRQPADSCKHCCRCCTDKEDRSFLEKAQNGMTGLVGADGQSAARSTDKPMKPQVVARELGKRSARRRHRHLRLAAPSPPGGRATSPRSAARCSRCSGNSGHHGLRAALHHRRADRLPGSPVRGLCRRRRLHHADGRVRHRREVQAADQDRRSSRTTRWARSNGSRWCSWAIRNMPWSCSRSTL